jgi:hypothetical protein
VEYSEDQAGEAEAGCSRLHLPHVRAQDHEREPSTAERRQTLIIIDEEFQSIIPPPTDEEKQQLEANIVADRTIERFSREGQLTWVKQ